MHDLICVFSKKAQESGEKIKVGELIVNDGERNTGQNQRIVNSHKSHLNIVLYTAGSTWFGRFRLCVRRLYV